MGDINRDPAMEEILASIKRVIAEDGRAPARPPRDDRSEDQPMEAPVEEDVLELSDPVSDADGLTSDDTTAAARQKLAAPSALRQPENGEPVALSEATPTATALAKAARERPRPLVSTAERRVGKEWVSTG